MLFNQLRNLLFAFIFLGNLGSINAQKASLKIDSLKQVISLQADDSIKVNTLITIGQEYLITNLDEALKYAMQAQQLAEQIKYEKGNGNAHKLMGQCYARQSNFPDAIGQFNASLEAYKSINYKDGISNILNNLGSVHFFIGEDHKSIDYHLQSLKIAEDIDSKFYISTNLNNIGTVYANKPATIDKALQYYLRALPIFKELNYAEGIGIASMNIGENYFKKGSYDSAITYMEASVNLYEGTIDATFPLSYLGEIYAERRDFDKAFQYHNQAIEIAERLGAKLELTQSLISLGGTQAKKGDLPNAISTYKNAIDISEEIRARGELKNAYEGISALYAEIGEFKNAYKYQTRLTSLKDTLYDSNEKNKMQQMQYNFDIGKKETEIQLQGATIQRQRIVTYATGISGFLLLVVAIGSYNRYKYIRKTNKIIKDERDRSKELLLNILPEETARELETNGQAQTRYYENATVLFTDFKDFSTIAGKLSPQELVAELNDYFMAFDEIMGKFNLEKIKTIGDAYMCAGGIPSTNNTHPLDAVNAALAMQDYMFQKNKGRKENNLECWELRIGIHTGPIVAGVVGKKKYAYDIWGDTVNVASRMESNGEAGKVNISASTYQRIKENYQCLYRGKVSAKNIGEVDMYFIESKITKPKLQVA